MIGTQAEAPATNIFKSKINPAFEQAAQAGVKVKYKDLLADLGLVGATLAVRPTASGILGALIVNPLQSFKLGAIYSLRATLDTLGPVGQYATYRFGDALPFLLGGLLAGGAVATFGIAFVFFKYRRDV